MRNFQPKNRFKSIMHSKIVLVLLGCLVVFFAWGVIGFMVKMETVRDNRELAEEKFLELEKKKIELSAQIARLNTEEGKEENIREKFGLAKEGEQLIVVVEDKNPPKPLEDESGGVWGFFKNLFK